MARGSAAKAGPKARARGKGGGLYRPQPSRRPAPVRPMGPQEDPAAEVRNLQKTIGNRALARQMAGASPRLASEDSVLPEDSQDHSIEPSSTATLPEVPESGAEPAAESMLDESQTVSAQPPAPEGGAPGAVEEESTSAESTQEASGVEGEARGEDAKAEKATTEGVRQLEQKAPKEGEGKVRVPTGLESLIEGKGEGTSEGGAAEAEGGEGSEVLAGRARSAAPDIASLAASIHGLARVTARDASFAPHPEETSTDPEVAALGTQRRAASEAAANDFVHSNVHYVETLLALSATATPRILGAAETAKAEVDTAVARNIGKVVTRISGAMAFARAQAAGAKARIGVERSLSVGMLRKATLDARAEIESLFDQVRGELETQESDQVGAISGLYSAWDPRFKATGAEVGGEAMSIAQRRARFWRSRKDDERSIEKDSLHPDRMDAKADAAVQVAEAYRENFKESAEEEAAKIAEGELGTLDYVRDSAGQARDGIGQQRDAILQSLEDAEKRACEQVNDVADKMSSSIDSSLATTVGSLARQKKVQIRRLREFSESQKGAIDDQAAQAIKALLQGAGQAADGFNESLLAFLESALALQAPDQKELIPVLAEVQAQTDALAVAMLQQMTEGILASEAGLGSGGKQVVQAVNKLGQGAVEQAQATVEQYSESVRAMLQQASGGFASLREGHETTTQHVKTSAKEGFEAAAESLRETFSKLSENVELNFTSTREELRGGLREAFPQLRSDIEDQAREAAEQVQPWWKSALKWVITIVVIVAVVAITILSAGALGPVGLILLGAALGAAAGAATTIGHNLVDDEEWTEGVGEAMVIGAIGGAFGGIGGALAGKVASVGLKFAIETGIDVVGGVLGDLLVGNPLTLEGILLGAAIGAGVGTGIGIAGAVKGKIKIRPRTDVSTSPGKPKAEVASPSPVKPKSRTRSFLERTGILAKTPEVSGGPKVNAPAAITKPDLQAPKSRISASQDDLPIYPKGRPEAGSSPDKLRALLGNKVIDPDNGVLEELFGRSRHKTNPIERRAAAGELEVLVEYLGRADVEGIRLVPHGPVGRTPDFDVHFKDGTRTRVEVTTITSAPVGLVTQKAGILEGGGTTKGDLAKLTEKRRPTKASVKRGIKRKGVGTDRKPTQLAARVEGLPEGGILEVVVQRSLSRSEAIKAVSEIGRLDESVRQLNIRVRGASGRETLVFRRVGEVLVLQ